jgi:putative oxidoreductase
VSCIARAFHFGNSRDRAVFQRSLVALIKAHKPKGAREGKTMAVTGERKLIFPALAGLYDRFSPYSYALMRFATGAVLVPHGVTKILNTPIAKFVPNIAAKGLPLPELLAYLTYFAESAAAACLAIGLFTRIAAAMIGIEMLVIVVLFQWQFGYFWTNRGYEYALLWAVLCIAIFFKGGGRYSIDRLIGREF